MSLSRLLKKFSQPNLARPAPTDPRAIPSNDGAHNPLASDHQQASEPTLTILRSWRKKRPSTIGHSSLSQPSTPSLAPGAENLPPEHGVLEIPLSMPFPTTPSVLSTTTATGPPRPLESAFDHVPVKLVETWNTIRDDPRVTDKSRGLDNAGDAVATTQKNAAPFMPTIEATVAGAEQTATAKAIKERIDKFSESMPIFMKALDELKSLHPFLGVVVLAFQTVYTLDQKRRDNDRKITSLFIGMRDMMGALFILKDMENDKLIAPDGLSIEDRLKSLVDRSADDIKMCSNVCDAYMKKRLLAKVLMSSVWDAKLLDFVQLFATRRQEFEFELTMHTSQGIDKANAKLDAIGEATRALNEQMNVMKALFQELVSPEQKRLSDLVAVKGRGKVLKTDDKALLELEKAAGKASGVPKAAATEVGHARREDSDTNVAADNLRRDIFEHPNVAVERNLTVFSRKFEAQKNQIVDEITSIVKRESDRVIQEVKGGPHERILDRSIYEIWTEMGWRGSVKARHFVLALRDCYLERLASGTESLHIMGAAGVNFPPDPDAWAIKYIDVIRLQPILEAIDDDASGFITIGEMNRFTASRPIDWSLPHWVAFWAVGYRASIIDYAHKIDELFSKMDGLRTEVLPINRNAITAHFADIWECIHSLIAPILSLQPGQDDSEKFRSYLEAEEARLENNLKAVDYIIDGIDTLTLIAGVGRIEKMVFPLVYLMMKHQYEIMRIMRTKVVDSRELSESTDSMLYVRDAIRYRVDDLTNNFSHQKLDVQKQFQNFAYGMFIYFSDREGVWSRVWSKDYILSLDPRPIPYDDSNEDQGVKVEDILRYKSLDEPSLDYSVYDGDSTDTSSYDNMESPLKEILGHWHGYFYESGGDRESQGIDSMMTLVLKPAEGERDIQGNGWSIRGRLNITGSWSMGENNVMNVKFKITSTPSPIVSWSTDFFNGHFDPERDALTGVWGSSDDPESSIRVGPLEFRRILPRYLVVYPSIKELSDNKSRALWRFAIAAVRSDIRQQRYFWSYFSQRRDDGKAVVTLLTRYLFFGNPLDIEEVRTLCAASQRLTPASACFYSSMVYRKRGHTLMHGDIRCDSCGGYIGGPRLFCLDCIDKNNTFATLDLCCTPESRCIEAYVSWREELLPHEPSHKLVKLRTAIPTYHLGRAYKLAHAAFERVEVFLPKIVEASQQSKDEKETEQDVQNVSTQDPTTGTAEQSSESDKPDDHVAELGGSQDAIEVEPATTDMPSEIDKSDGVPTAANGTQGGVEAEPTVTEAPRKSDDVLNTTESTDDKIETEDRQDNTSQTTAQAQLKDGDVPACGSCNRSLSFPFWYCIFCEDTLFICDECDSKGVPDVIRSSGKHTEEHHLIRCLRPEQNNEDVNSPEQRLISIEGRLADMQTQFNDLCSRMGNLEELIRNLAGTTKGD